MCFSMGISGEKDSFKTEMAVSTGALYQKFPGVKESVSARQRNASAEAISGKVTPCGNAIRYPAEISSAERKQPCPIIFYMSV